MAESGEILELKFEGNKVNPETVKPHEVAELIINFERALLSTIKQESPEINTEHLLFSFHSIENRSLDLKFITHAAKDAVFKSYSLISLAITTQNFKELNYDTVESLQEISKFTKRHECIGQFKRNDFSLATFNKDTQIEFDKTNELKGETRIYGKVLRVGGENPTVNFKVNNEYKITFNVKESFARDLATKLYDDIGLDGIATWDIKSYQVTNFKINKIINYEPKPLKETFSELRKLIGKHWDKIDDVNSVLGYE